MLARRQPCTDQFTNHIQRALSLFKEGPLALVAGEGFEPSTSGLRALRRVSLPVMDCLWPSHFISVDLRRKAVLSLLRLARPVCPAEFRAQIRAQFWFLTAASTSLPTWPGDRGDGYRARQDELLDGLGETFVLV